jgi:hypothetical protein
MLVCIRLLKVRGCSVSLAVQNDDERGAPLYDAIRIKTTPCKLI